MLKNQRQRVERKNPSSVCSRQLVQSLWSNPLMLWIISNVWVLSQISRCKFSACKPPTQQTHTLDLFCCFMEQLVQEYKNTLLSVHSILLAVTSTKIIPEKLSKETRYAMNTKKTSQQKMIIRGSLPMSQMLGKALVGEQTITYRRDPETNGAKMNSLHL